MRGREKGGGEREREREGGRREGVRGRERVCIILKVYTNS